MNKVELLLPAGNIECLRAAVHNGADAVYLGLSRFNARQSADNFNEKNIHSIVEFCHERNVKVYVALNTLVKNNEIKDYLLLAAAAYDAGVDALIIQDSCFIDILKKNFPKVKIHLSTQATVTNSYMIPKRIDRCILARELSLEEIRKISSSYETEVFIHGALCFCYSGQCLFSSFVGGRSGNRGMCAQPCRKMYNNKYPMSTKDLCMIEKIPELINAGVSCFKIEGRMRSPFYVASAAKAYRRAIDSYYEGNFSVDEELLSDLKLAFNREFTTGFAFNKKITDPRKPMNRGLYLGKLSKGKIKLNEPLCIGDGVGIWKKDKVIGQKINSIKKGKEDIEKAFAGDIVDLGLSRAKENDAVYKTSSINVSYELGDEVNINEVKKKYSIDFPQIKKKENTDDVRIFVKVYNKKSAIEADKAKADVIYYDVLKEDFAEVMKQMKNSRFFAYTPSILSDEDVKKISERIKNLNPEGVLVRNKGLLSQLKGYELHLDSNFNCFNDMDIDCYKGVPVISSELNFDEVMELHNKNFIVKVHGDIILMTTKEPLKYPELVDEEERRFRVIKHYHSNEILNEKQIGLFNFSRKYVEVGVKYFMIDLRKEVGKFVRIYRKILSGEKFDDRKIKKGYTTGHFVRGIS